MWSDLKKEVRSRTWCIGSERWTLVHSFSIYFLSKYTPFDDLENDCIFTIEFNILHLSFSIHHVLLLLLCAGMHMGWDILQNSWHQECSMFVMKHDASHVFWDVSRGCSGILDWGEYPAEVYIEGSNSFVLRHFLCMSMIFDARRRRYTVSIS